MTKVYLALGSNLGERPANLRAAIGALEEEVHILRQSHVYETEPWGFEDQPKFLNQVVEGETSLAPEDLLIFIKTLEQQLGRQETFRYGPREIDIDILLYGDRIIDRPDLQIPHPRLGERAFVLVPLSDLSPDIKNPRTGKTVTQMLGDIDQKGVNLYGP